jgi:hypothetical protein
MTKEQHPDINDTLRAGGPDAVRARHDQATTFDGGSGGDRGNGPRKLFGLEKLDSKPEAVVLLVVAENENKAQRLATTGIGWNAAFQAEIIPLSWLDGATVSNSDLAPLAGREVVIASRKNTAGERSANALITALQQNGVQTLRRWRAPAELPAGWHLTDPLPDGYDPDKLAASMLTAPEIPQPPPHATPASGAQEEAPAGGYEAPPDDGYVPVPSYEENRRMFAEPEVAQPAPKLILTLDEWLARELAEPDPLLGSWLTTTSRVLLNAPTGIGKTMFAIAMAIAIAGALGFLHWRGVRPARVLFIDGEMSRRLLRQRLTDEVSRIGIRPPGMHILSHEDVDRFAPLNSKEGQGLIERVIKDIGGVDLIIFDNIMSLLAGNMKETEQWAATLPWVRSLTRRKIGQFWMHHTNEENKSYGDKTREWQMDTVILGEEVKRADTDVSFQLTFRKARERTPTTRANFADTRIALVNDQWISDAAITSTKQKVSPLGKKFFDALVNATIDSDAKKMFNLPTATLEEWRAECIKIGVLDKDKPKSASALFSKHKRELIAANKVACNETIAWTLPN